MRRDGGVLVMPAASGCEHVLHPHFHVMIPDPDPKKALLRSRPCSGRFWCAICRSWLDGPACAPVTVAA